VESLWTQSERSETRWAALVRACRRRPEGARKGVCCVGCMQRRQWPNGGKCPRWRGRRGGGAFRRMSVTTSCSGRAATMVAHRVRTGVRLTLIGGVGEHGRRGYRLVGQSGTRPATGRHRDSTAPLPAPTTNTGHGIRASSFGPLPQQPPRDPPLSDACSC
jgi:hypothetical protein